MISQNPLKVACNTILMKAHLSVCSDINYEVREGIHGVTY